MFLLVSGGCHNGPTAPSDAPLAQIPAYNRDEWVHWIDADPYKRSTGFKDFKAAKQRALEIETELRKGVLGWTQKKVVTAAEWAARYQKAYSVRKKRPERDRQMLAHALPMFGSKRMDEITEEDCEAYLALRSQQGAHAWTVRRERGFLCAFWNKAIANGKTTHVVGNPWHAVKPPKCHARERILDTDEQIRMMAHANPEYQRALTVLLGTGLRANEFLHLRLADIKKGHINVRWQTSKGDKSRDVPLLPEVAHAMRTQATALNRGAFDRLWQQTDWAILKTVKKIAKRAGVDNYDDLRTHDLRRTFGTRCAEAGMPMKRLSIILGHSSTAVTEQYYTHLNARDNAAALGKVASVLSLGVIGGVIENAETA